MWKRAAVLALLLLAACDEPADSGVHISAVGDFTAEQGEIMQRAADAFAAACPDLFTRFAKDVESVTLTVHWTDKDLRAYDYRYERYGWDRYVYIAVKIVDDPSRIPNKWRAFGHTLHYYLGGGRAPGVISQKDQSQLVCGWPAGRGDDVHVPVAAVSIVDGL